MEVGADILVCVFQVGAEWDDDEVPSDGEGVLLLQPFRVSARAIQQTEAGQKHDQFLRGQQDECL